MVQYISATAYSKQRGVTVQAILKAIADGRMPHSARRHGRGFVIDSTLADAELAANTTQGHGGKRVAGETIDRQPVQPPPKEPAGGPPDGSGDSDETYMEAKTRLERFKADLAALDLAEKEGRLVEAAAVEREAFRVARLVRDSILNIPDRIAGDLAAEDDQFAVHQKLTAELRKALEGLSV